ncbi:MAG: FHA domain-containing protein [Albidovulum sp.]|uniref:FHA domain-containing protein n=1 Tax=Albidovulum sp. TaxID=1872424 RepID=UPI003CA27C3B
MGIFGKLLGRSGHDGEPSQERGIDVSDLNVPPLSDAVDALRTKTVRLSDDDFDAGAELASAPAPEAPAAGKTEAPLNIWDLDGESAPPTPAPAAPVAAAEPARTERPAPSAPSQLDVSPRVGDAPARKRRTKTRLLGFDKSDGQVVDLFNNPVQSSSRGSKYPVGWVVVVKGPGRGESFTLQSGMTQIGRGDDQTVQLDFGDNAISRTNHAAIVYDPESHQVFLGHGGKSNIVRLNSKPVISNEVLSNGDLIRLGETTLRFVALCDADFNWDGEDSEEADNVEIA